MLPLTPDSKCTNFMLVGQWQYSVFQNISTVGQDKKTNYSKMIFVFENFYVKVQA